MEVLAERLKWLRDKRRLGQKEVAAKLDITLSGYQKLEYNQANPKIDTLIKMSELFGESTDFLLGVDDSTNSLFKESLMIDLYRIQIEELQLKVSELTMQSYSLEARIDDMRARIRGKNDVGELNIYEKELTILKSRLNDVSHMKIENEKQIYEYTQERNKMLIEYIKDIFSIPYSKPHTDHILKEFVPYSIEIQPNIFDEHELQIYGKSIGFIGHIGNYKTIEEAESERLILKKRLNGNQHENILR